MVPKGKNWGTRGDRTILIVSVVVVVMVLTAAAAAHGRRRRSLEGWSRRSGVQLLSGEGRCGVQDHQQQHEQGCKEGPHVTGYWTTGTTTVSTLEITETRREVFPI